jgi:hypothetical protein
MVQLETFSNDPDVNEIDKSRKMPATSSVGESREMR